MRPGAREARHLTRCAACREAAPVLGVALRTLPAPQLSPGERARVWAAVRRGIEARRRPELGAFLPRLRGLVRRRPTLAWAAAVAAAVTLVLAPLHVGRERRVFSQAELNAQTTVEHVDAAPFASVLLLETPRQHLSIIWVIEDLP